MYGFIIRYPQGKESVTGYVYEPWHIRYVGVEHATKIMNQRNEYKNEMINELNELGYNVSVLDELIPTNTKEERPSIIINKGKIIEVQTIIDNTDYALIEKLNTSLTIPNKNDVYLYKINKPKLESNRSFNIATMANSKLELLFDLIISSFFVSELRSNSLTTGY